MKNNNIRSKKKRSLQQLPFLSCNADLWTPFIQLLHIWNFGVVLEVLLAKLQKTPLVFLTHVVS